MDGVVLSCLLYESIWRRGSDFGYVATERQEYHIYQGQSANATLPPSMP